MEVEVWLVHRGRKRNIENPIDGKWRGLRWQNGIHAVNSEEEARSIVRRVGGEYEKKVFKFPGDPVLDSMPKTLEVVEGTTNSSKDGSGFNYQDKLKILNSAKEYELFDWFEYTDGSRKGDDVADAFDYLKTEVAGGSELIEEYK
jgi:hypothetical protein